MSEPTGDQWAGSYSLSEDGSTVTIEASEGKSLNMPVDKFYATFNKGLGYDESTQKAGAKTTELQGQFDELTKEHGGWQTTFQRFVDKLQGMPEGTDIDAELDRAFGTLGVKPDNKPASDDDSWLAGDAADAAPTGMTQEAVAKYVKGELQKRDDTTRDSAKVNAQLSEAFDNLRVPKGMRADLEDASLKYAFANGGTIADAVEHQWKTLVDGMKGFGEAETEREEAEKHATGKSISRAGHRATSGDDPRAKAPLGSKENKEYLNERMQAILDRE